MYQQISKSNLGNTKNEYYNLILFIMIIQSVLIKLGNDIFLQITTFSGLLKSLSKKIY